MENKTWKRIIVEIPTTLIFIRRTALGESICYGIMYRGIRIGRLFCNGLVEFINKENWKDRWEFKAEYDDDGNKQFYKRSF